MSRKNSCCISLGEWMQSVSYFTFATSEYISIRLKIWCISRTLYARMTDNEFLKFTGKISQLQCLCRHLGFFIKHYLGGFKKYHFLLVVKVKFSQHVSSSKPVHRPYLSLEAFSHRQCLLAFLLHTMVLPWLNHCHPIDIAKMSATVMKKRKKK